ncbi:MAG: protein-disulfide reductase DsbD family protein [Ignavibacteriaceae bacterium]|nr:protein-disulfide reductase DsbD family protein [Ignavibacteriaceae bacterium]
MLTIYLNAQQTSAANAKILVDSFSLGKSRVIPIGILIDLEKDWHIYWRNPGDSGMPTSIDFELPDGVSISEIKWPVPKVFEYEGLASYGYDGQILLIAELNVPENFVSNSITVTAKIKSLICRDVCIPFNATVSKEIVFQNNFKAEEQVSNLFSRTRKSLPEVNSDFELSVIPGDDLITIIIQTSNDKMPEPASIYFLPYENGLFKNTVDQKFSTKENQIELRVEYDQFKTEELRELLGVLVFQFDDTAQSQKVYEIKKQINTNN